MTFKQSSSLLFLFSVIVVVAGLGCSDGTFTSSTNEVSEQANPLAYIPLEQGLRVDYAMFEDDQISYYEVEVADPVTVIFNPAYEIRRTNRISGETSIVYRYQKDNAIFETTSLNDPGYRILEGPFVAGHSWDRYESSSSETTIKDYNDGDNNGLGKNGITINGRNYKVLPDGEYGTMSIVGFEDVQALNGASYGQCLKVAWHTDPLHTNYYWYSSGIGLIKFEQGINTVNPADEPISVLMTDYQVVEY